jgi:hypothetical protein
MRETGRKIFFIAMVCSCVLINRGLWNWFSIYDRNRRLPLKIIEANKKDELKTKIKVIIVQIACQCVKIIKILLKHLKFGK